MAPRFMQSRPPAPIKLGITLRLKNMCKNNFRGLAGVLVPLIALSWQPERGVHLRTVEIMWMMMFWFFLLQPVAIPVVGLIPIFLLPMAGVMSTIKTCQCYMNENVILYMLTGMIVILLNNSGVDRRIALWFICSGDPCQYSGKRLVFKVSSAAFFLSMSSSRLIATSTLTQYMTSALVHMEQVSVKTQTSPNFQEMRFIINNAIQTASGIGSIAILHTSYVTVLFRAIFSEAPARDKEYPDIFNYLQYSAFAFPVALVMFIFNCSYHMFLINWYVSKPMTAVNMVDLRNYLVKKKEEIPPRISLHEKLSILFLFLFMLMLLLRWNQWIDGWAEFRRDEFSTEIPRVKDATVAAIFLILLHIVPKGYGFLSFVSAEKKSQLPPLKPESPLLWWRFVDKNINYGYLFLFGAGISLMNSARDSGLALDIAEHIGIHITGKPWSGGLFIVCFITALLANVMPAMAACAIFLPLVMCMSVNAALPWPSKVYCPALGVGIASSLGFCSPFQYSPGYYTHHQGKVPTAKMAKYSFLSVWICTIILWLALLIWAPFLFDPGDFGILPVDAPGGGATTAAVTPEPPAPDA